MNTAAIVPSYGHGAAFAAVLLFTCTWLVSRLRVPPRFMAALLGWQALMGWLAWAQYFTRFDQPWRVLPTVGLGLGVAIWLALRPWQTVAGRWLGSTPPWSWVALQTFRLPLEALLYSLFAHGAIGRQMTFAGYNFDILIGLTAAPMAWLLHRHGTHDWVRRCAIAWNLLGLVLLVNIVSIAVLSIPFSFQVFRDEPANRFVTQLPFVWLPTFLVPVALLAHLSALRLLARRCLPQPIIAMELRR